MYSIAATVNNTALHSWNCLEILKALSTRKKNSVTVYDDKC